MDAISFHIHPGFLEVFTGSMKSGKSRELLHKLDKITYMHECDFLLAKPSTDTRSSGLLTRHGNMELTCHLVPWHEPHKLLEMVGGEKLIAIDEVQLFSDEIIDVIKKLQMQGRHVCIAGLDLDFRGEPFGPMPKLLCLADQVHKLKAICDVPNCNNLGTRPQRFLNGKPSVYTDPIILIDGIDAQYEVRCVKHHIVPGHPLQKEQSLTRF